MSETLSKVQRVQIRTGGQMNAIVSPFVGQAVCVIVCLPISSHQLALECNTLTQGHKERRLAT